MVTRHSMHVPMPHKGLRGSPETDRRNAVTPACAMAAATTVPGTTAKVWPFIVRWMGSDMRVVKSEIRIAPFLGASVSRQHLYHRLDGVRYARGGFRRPKS